MSVEFVERLYIDLCNKSFTILSDKGNSKTVTCDNTEEFMNVLECAKSNLDDDKIHYAELNIYENSND